MEHGSKIRLLAVGLLLLFVRVTHAETVTGPATAISSPCTERELKNAPVSASSASATGSPPVPATSPCMEPQTTVASSGDTKSEPGRVSAEQPQSGTVDAPSDATGDQGDTESEPAGNMLRTISVSASRVEKDPTKAPVTLSIISADAIQEMVATSIKDLIRYEPGISVGNNPSRFGMSGFNIRGLDGNRILIQMDGIRQPDSFLIGGFSNAGRNMVDVGMLSGVEIQRGAGSSLQGSEGIGGVVSYRSPEPEDYLKGRSFAVSPEGIYQGVDRSLGLIGTLAAGNDYLKLMLRGVQRTGHEVANMGTVGGTGIDRTKPNPQDVNTLNGLAKLVFTPFPSYRATFAAEGFERVVDTDVLSLPRVGGRVGLTGADKYERQRVSLDQRIANTPLGTVNLKLYRQYSRTNQYTNDQILQFTSTGSNRFLLERDFDFRQVLTGAKLQNESVFELLGAHTLVWGGEAFRTETTQIRDGLFTDFTNGTTTKLIGGLEWLPTRDFPPSSTTQLAGFLQDEWYLSERITLVTGLRYDNYHLNPHPDALYVARNPGVKAEEVRLNAFSPKASLIFNAGLGFSFVAQYSQGFRPPPYNDVNIGFTNLGAFYTTIANPDLKPEIVRGGELSVRHHSDRGSVSFTAYDNRYEDFIDTSRPLTCPGDPLCVPGMLTFQSRNLPRVRIYGFEGRMDQQLFPGWRLRGSFAWTKGRDLDTGLPIIQVNPASGVLGLSYERGPFRVEGLVTASMRKTLKESRGVNRLLQPPAYTVVDLLAQWRFASKGRLSVGIFNLLDEKYWHWADVPVNDIHTADTRGGPDRYTRPGRNFSVSLSYRF